MADNVLVKAIVADHAELAKAVALFRADEAGDDELLQAIDVVRAHLERERDAVREVGEEPPGWKEIEKIDNWTYEIETMNHDLSNAVYKDAIDGMTRAIEKHMAWDTEVLAPLLNGLPDDAAKRIATAGDE